MLESSAKILGGYTSINSVLQIQYYRWRKESPIVVQKHCVAFCEDCHFLILYYIKTYVQTMHKNNRYHKFHVTYQGNLLNSFWSTHIRVRSTEYFKLCNFKGRQRSHCLEQYFICRIRNLNISYRSTFFLDKKLGLHLVAKCPL